MGGLVEILLGAADLVLAGLAVLLDAVQLLHRLATDVAHRHLGVLALGLGLLDQLAATLLGQLRDGDPDDVAVVGRVHAEVGVADRVLDVAQLAGLVGLDDDQPRLGDVDARQLGDRRRRAVVVDVDAGEHAGLARPVRIDDRSSRATDTAFSIFSSASKRVSSITAFLLVRW